MSKHIVHKRLSRRKDLIKCPKCHKPSWMPQKHVLTNKYGTYQYWVYRHPDKRKKSPRKCYMPIDGEEKHRK